MPTVDAPRMTVEEFLALPDDGVERMLIDGVVRELGMTVRRWRHAAVQVNVAYLLKAWARRSARAARPRRRRRGRIPPRDRGRCVGIDVAYASPELAAATPDRQAYFDGSPTLAVEVLSPSDKQEDIDDKIGAYLARACPRSGSSSPDSARSRCIARTPSRGSTTSATRSTPSRTCRLPGAGRTIFED